MPKDVILELVRVERNLFRSLVVTFEERDQCPTSLQLDSVHTSSDGYLHVLLHQYSVRIPVFGSYR
jgi:hypothetical protein